MAADEAAETRYDAIMRFLTMPMSRITTGVATTVAAVLSMTCVALADRIDGNWCSATGKHLRIEGARITIPSGAEITGQYDRHAFRYNGPEGDPEAGQTIEMRQLSEEEMLLQRTVGGQTQPIENWRRCQAIS